MADFCRFSGCVNFRTLLVLFATTGILNSTTIQAADLSPGSPEIPSSVAWEERLYNPQPLMDDLILPAPCGGAMVFRPVTTPNTDGVIGDVPVLLGQQGSDQPFLDGLRRSYVSGAFPSDSETSRGLFYMAKYELTEAQQAVLMADGPEKCPSRVSRRMSSPVTDLSKLSFEELAERYSLWLMKHAPESLPVAGESTAYIRLPTEEEWEFAARGGLGVSEAQFRAALPPMAEGESAGEYIAHNGSDSAGGKLQLIGTLKPNPIGLHDMLGNAWEFVGSPFALVRHGRLHGQAGGIVRRGGGVNWPLAEITSAQRFEMAPYNSRKLDVQTERFTGARFVISAISITSDEQNSALLTDLDRLIENDTSLPAAQSEQEVRALLEQMQKDALSEGDRNRLQLVAETLDAAQAERKSQRDKGVRMILNSAVLLCNQAAQRYLTQRFAAQTVIQDLKAEEAYARENGDEGYLTEILALKELALSKMKRLEELLTQDAIEYANLIEGLGADYAPGDVRAQADFIRPDHTEQNNARRAACYGLLRTHLETRFAVGQTDIVAMRDDFRTAADAAMDAQ